MTDQWSGGGGRDPGDRTPAAAYSLADLGLVNAPPDPALQDLIDSLRRVLVADVAVFAVVEARLDRLFLTAQSGLQEPWASGREVPLGGRGAEAEALAPVFAGIRELSRHPDLPAADMLRQIGVRAVLAAKVADPAGLPAGFVGVLHRAPRDWTAEDRMLLARTARQTEREILLRASLQTLRLIRRSG